MMTNKIFRISFFIALCGVILISCNTKKEYISTWDKQELTITDTVPTLKGMLYDSKSGILYKISNTNEYLLFDLQVNNEIVQKKILLFGMTIWIDQLGKTKKYTGVKFPLGSSGLKKPSDNKMKEHGGSFSQRKMMIADESYEIALIGLRAKDDLEIIDTRYKDGAKANISFDSFGLMHYYLKLPIEKVNMTFESLSLINPSICFETGHAEMRQSQGQGSGMKSGGGGGRQGGGGGRQGGGGGKQGAGATGNNPEMQAMSQSTSFWVKNIKIAKVITE